MVPADKADEARKLVEAAPRGKATGTKTRGHTYSPRVCKDCGCRINYGVYCGKCEYR
jgi:hypothetical protein